jgi:enoyl-CoA hydratase/carnithine racemase
VVEIERRGEQGEVAVLRMRAGENRFAPPFVRALNEALDELEAGEGPLALVTIGDGRFYSNGLDLAWMGGEDGERAQALLEEVLRLFARILAFPAYSVAAINGHAFAAGLMLALAHDARVMRADRGFACLPEVDLGLPLHPGMTALVRARLPIATAHEAIVTGRRYGGGEAAAAALVDEAVPEDALLERAVARAAAFAGKGRGAMPALKRGLYAEVLHALEGGAAG